MSDGTVGDLFVSIRVDPRLADKKDRSGRFDGAVVSASWTRSSFFLVSGFAAGFLFPLSEEGSPVVHIDGRFFALGFLGLTGPLVLDVPSVIGPLRGRRRQSGFLAPDLRPKGHASYGQRRTISKDAKR